MLHNQEVIKIDNSDVSTSLLKDVIKCSPHSFEVSPEALINLKNQKVPDAVVKEMLLNLSSEGFTVAIDAYANRYCFPDWAWTHEIGTFIN